MCKKNNILLLIIIGGLLSCSPKTFMAVTRLFLMFFFTQQYSWAQDQIEFFLVPETLMQLLLILRTGVSLVHFLCTWISKYSLFSGKVAKKREILIFPRTAGNTGI
jgi:hypothetical protein